MMVNSSTQPFMSKHSPLQILLIKILKLMKDRILIQLKKKTTTYFSRQVKVNINSPLLTDSPEQLHSEGLLSSHRSSLVYCHYYQCNRTDHSLQLPMHWACLCHVRLHNRRWRHRLDGWSDPRMTYQRKKKKKKRSNRFMRKIQIMKKKKIFFCTLYRNICSCEKRRSYIGFIY